MSNLWAKIRSALAPADETRLMKSLADNQPGLSPELLALLVQDFRNLTGGAQGLAERLTRHAVTGEDEAVVAELPALLPQLKSTSSYAFTHPRQSRFLSQVSSTDAHLFYRLARLYSEIAVCKGYTARANPQMALGASADLYPFLTALINSRENASHSFPVSVLEEVYTLAGCDADAIARATYMADPDDYWGRTSAGILSGFGGFADYSVRHRHVVVE